MKTIFLLVLVSFLSGCVKIQSVKERDEYMAKYDNCHAIGVQQALEIHNLKKELESCQEGADLLAEMWEESNKEINKWHGLQLQIMQESCRQAIFDALQSNN